MQRSRSHPSASLLVPSIYAIVTSEIDTFGGAE